MAGRLVKTDGTINSAKYKDISSNTCLPLSRGYSTGINATFNKMVTQTYTQINTEMGKETKNQCFAKAMSSSTNIKDMLKMLCMEKWTKSSLKIKEPALCCDSEL